MKITVAHNQSLLDIAIQYAGSAQAAFEIARANGLSLTEDLQAWQMLEISEAALASWANKDIADYYRSNGLLPATAATDTFVNELFEAGIGEMIIEKNFIVR